MTAAALRARSLSRRALQVLVSTSWAAWMLTCSCAFAQTEERKTADADAQPSVPEQKKPSPWLFAPVFNSSPKLGVTLGAMAGYLHCSTRNRGPPYSL